MRRSKSSKRRRKDTKTTRALDVVIPPGADGTFQVLRSRKRPLTRAALQALAGKAVAELIWATCRWRHSEWTLGDFRFLVFSTNPSRRVQLYIQFWSEPEEEVCWEVCSGKWNPPADKVMAGAPSESVERLGFAMGGEAENFQRYLWIRTRRAAEQAARVVLDIFYDAFGYRGLTPIEGQFASDSRGEWQRVFNSFAPEDLCKTARRIGWTPQLNDPAGADDDDADGPAVIDLQQGDARAQIVLSAPVPGEGRFQSAFVDVGNPMPADEARTRTAMQETAGLPDDTPMRVGRTLYFAGWVTADWLLTQIAAALQMAETVTARAARRVH
jgi:hypothetical protein